MSSLAAIPLFVIKVFCGGEFVGSATTNLETGTTITAAHVARRCDSSKFSYINDKHDLAVMGKLKSLKGFCDAEPLKVHSTLSTAGWVASKKEVVYGEGIFLAEKGKTGTGTALVTYGMSGGAVSNSDNQFVGLIRGFIGTDFSVFVTAEFICKELKPVLAFPSFKVDIQGEYSDKF